MFRQFLTDEEGATAIEYGLIASLIFIVIINSVQAFADASNANFTRIAAAVDAVIHSAVHPRSFSCASSCPRSPTTTQVCGRSASQVAATALVASGVSASSWLPRPRTVAAVSLSASSML